jgi:hypothetical protein
MNTYQCWISGQMGRTSTIIEAESSFAARKIISMKYDLDVFDAIARRIDPNLDAVARRNRHGYNAEAVNEAITSSNRHGRHIGPKEAKAIHALLKGRN